MFHHKGKNDIEVDIVSLGELRQFQAEGSIVCGGRNALAVSAPFGWIIDGTRRGFAPAVLYRRGIAFEDVTEKEKEWKGLQLGNIIPQLILLQKSPCLKNLSSL